MLTKSCTNCQHFHREPDGQFMCRRFPPTWTLMMGPGKAPGISPPVMVKRSDQPGANPSGLCGEHKTKVEVKP